MIDKILEAYINVALYQPLQGRSYMDLPQKLKNKKAILNIQHRDNQCPRWALRAALFKPRGDMRRTSSYPTEERRGVSGLDFTGIDFPTGQYKMQTADLVCILYPVCSLQSAVCILY